jgi:2-isopropylmalate synthase
VTGVLIYDCTLRDGCQGAGISLSLQDKLDIAHRLDEFGMDYVEGGWPGSNPKDAEFFDALRAQPLANARLSAFGSTRRAGIRAEDDRNLQLLLAAETPTVALVAKSWDFHVTTVLRTTLEENLAMVRDSVAFMKANGKEVVLDAEHFFDGYRADRAFALEVLEAAAETGADWLVLCDTNGGSLPEQITAAVQDVAERLDTSLGIHVHNDGELAVANTLAAVAAGARQVQGTVNGYGERIGNANLCSVIPNLVLKMESTCTAASHLSELTALSSFVDQVANVPPSPRLPFVGFAAFAHKGGIHVQAVSLHPKTYEHVDPALVGNARRILISELSGRNNVVERARELGLELDPDGPRAREIVAKVKELENEGFEFEDAEASFELLVRRASEGYVRPFEPAGYDVTSRKSGDEEATSSVASAQVSVGGEFLHGEATGGGPINALEKAIRAALLPAYPHLARIALTDFRAQIAHGPDPTRGIIRVRITGSAEGCEPWTTVGSAPDILHAAWLALADCLEFAVLTRAGVTAAVEHPVIEAVPLAELAPQLADGVDEDILGSLSETDWRETALDLEEAADRTLAASAVAMGAALFYSFGNFCAVAAHPDRRSVARVNVLKGRPENQVGSITTTRDGIDALFDWSRLPDGLTRNGVAALIDDFYELGPMGFRGPALPQVPDHLTSLDGQLRTTQLIAPGYRCPSNELISEALELAGVDYLFITSANVSSGITGHLEPAHYDLRGIQEDFGDSDGVVFIGHRNEATVRASYPSYLPMSTSILAFHRLASDEDGRPTLILERHGSLHADDVRQLVARRGFGLVLGLGARERLPMRDDATVAL